MDTVTVSNKKASSFSEVFGTVDGVKGAVEAFSEFKKNPECNRMTVHGFDLSHQLGNPDFEKFLSMLLDLRTNDPAEFEIEVVCIARVMRPIHRVSPVKNGSVAGGTA